jgi:hypothetical protein
MKKLVLTAWLLALFFLAVWRLTPSFHLPILNPGEGRVVPEQPPPAREPETCKELVAVLKERGLKVTGWGPLDFSFGIWLQDGDPPHPHPLALIDIGIYNGIAVVRQRRSAKDAKEIAGTSARAIHYGRFVISGDQGLVREIGQKLGIKDLPPPYTPSPAQIREWESLKALQDIGNPEKMPRTAPGDAGESPPANPEKIPRTAPQDAGESPPANPPRGNPPGSKGGSPNPGVGGGSGGRE